MASASGAAAASSPLVPTALELLRLAHGTLRQATSPEKKGAAELRAHMLQSTDKTLRQDLRALASLLQEAMLQEDDDKEDDEDACSSSSSTTLLSASFSEALSLTDHGRGRKETPSPSVDGAGRLLDAQPRCCVGHRHCDPMMTPSLLTEIVDFLGLVPNDESSSSPDMAMMKDARATLGTVASVCRLWKDVASTDRYFKRLTKAFLPLLPGKAEDVEESPNKGEHCRQVLVRYGRCLSLPAVRDGDDWQTKLELSFEIVDAFDGTRLFSASGPIDLIMSSESGLTALRLTGPHRTEITRPFSAASRDPEKQRFQTMKDFFAQSSQPQYPTALCVRVVGRDVRTGKQALLYQSHKSTQRSVKVSTLAYWQQYLRPNSLFVWEPWSRWSTGEGNQANEMVEISTSFYVSPIAAGGSTSHVNDAAPVAVVGAAAAGEGGINNIATGGDEEQANVEPTGGAMVENAKHQLYVVMGGDSAAYRQHNSFVALQFRTLDASIPARYIKAALAAGSK